MVWRNPLIGGFLIFSTGLVLSVLSRVALRHHRPIANQLWWAEWSANVASHRGKQRVRPAGGLMGQHALIADPDPTRAAIYAGILKQDGLYAILAKDGSAVTTALSDRGPPAVAIVDLALGLEVVERLRRAAPSTALPIIVVSALRTERDLATTHRARLGISAILAKAASEESIRRVVRRLLGIATGDEIEAPPLNDPGASLLEPRARADSGVRRREDGSPLDERPPVPGKTSLRR